VRHARGTAHLAGVRTPRLNHAFGAQMILPIATLILLSSVVADVEKLPCSVDLDVENTVSEVDISGKEMIPPDLFKVRIRNRGSGPVVLVMPGDGSEDGRRTPIVKWQVELVGSLYKPPKVGRCGNINALVPDEVFELKPGESRLLPHWIPPVWVTQSGTYRLRLVYQNDPSLKWSGIPLGEHDRKAMLRVRGSTDCVAVSNEVVIEAIVQGK
jgi:hypothetical protein